MSAFVTGELYNKDITVDNILQAMKTAEQKIIDSYYGGPFIDESLKYKEQRGNKIGAFSREINQDKYHKVMKQYFKINENDILTLLQKANKMQEFTDIINNLIMKLDPLLESVKQEHNQ